MARRDSGLLILQFWCHGRTIRVLAAGAGNLANYVGFLAGEAAVTTMCRHFTAIFAALFRRLRQTAAGFPLPGNRPYIKMSS